MIDRPEPPLSAEALEERLRSLARTFFGAAGVDDLELRHLLEILSRSSLLLDPEQNVLLVRGAVPGPPNGLVVVKKRDD